ncbi:Flp pilus assembly protein TadG [Novosphingobium sp. SG751A]|uniref:TadE/TadG family type IV pilus assembly protein n=1 Tax=Novosphingobium sp. SG751A TaxID=2587000 RepID=UPI0015580767|nr:TadE/TadG family type IV pilus assembly protein [Novosphingobium sp. SG751A]NOW45212.1 Flp pilus assembly protein TadG [Novosphingobium sp. SG751A]
MLTRHPVCHLARSRDGAALVEFAFVLPVLLIIFIGGYVVADMIACSRKVTVATRALSDLVGRNVSPSTTVTSATLTTYMNSAQLVMTPMPAAQTTLQISNLRVCDATHAYVVWSQAQTNGATVASSLTVGSVVSIPANLITTPMVPTSPDGSNVCQNTTSGANKVVVGTAGGYIFLGQISFSYTPPIGLGALTSIKLSDQDYMIPRLP